MADSHLADRSRLPCRPARAAPRSTALFAWSPRPRPSVIRSSLLEGFMFPVLGLATGFAAFALISVLLSVAKVGYCRSTTFPFARTHCRNRAHSKRSSTLPRCRRTTRHQEARISARLSPRRNAIGRDQVRPGSYGATARHEHLHSRCTAVEDRSQTERALEMAERKDLAQSNPFVGRRATLLREQSGR